MLGLNLKFDWKKLSVKISNDVEGFNMAFAVMLGPLFEQRPNLVFKEVDYHSHARDEDGN